MNECTNLRIYESEGLWIREVITWGVYRALDF